MTTLKLGTRKSPLALWQAHHVKGLLESAFAADGLAVELILINTQGDQILDRALSAIGGKGLFTTELENALTEGRIDLAVHSYKDLPTENPAGLIIGAVPPRGPCEDAFVLPRREGGPGPEPVPTLAEVARLLAQRRLATGSLRRKAQLLALFPGIGIDDVRGNVGTRLAKLDANTGWDGMILARAGLERLGLGERIAYVFRPGEMLHAVAQGALAVQCRADDGATQTYLRAIHDGPTARAVAAERGVLATLGGGCQVPIAAHATLTGETMTLAGLVASLDGQTIVRAQTSAAGIDTEAAAFALGAHLAHTLKAQGADPLLQIPRSG
jgi:hydroxymethylbilane synthase